MIAAKFGDPVLGVDIHLVNAPPPAPPTTPVPLPHPFVGVVFDPVGAAVGAAMGAVLGGGGPVLVNGMPAGNTGTEVKAQPHVPMPPGVGFHPTDMPPGNEGTLVTGSKTVEFGGSSESRTASMVMSCNFPVNLPTSVCLAVPMGLPVLIGGPEAMDFGVAAGQAIRTKWVSGKLHKATGATKGSKRSKVICFLTGHPVDVVTGELIAEAVDAELPGLVPLVFERNYRSRETEDQSLGPGWYHFFDAYVDEGITTTTIRLPDGRPADHPPLRVGEEYFHKPDRYTLARDADAYRLVDEAGLTHVFKPTEPAQAGRPKRHRLVEIRDRARNRIELRWKGPYLAEIEDTAGRRIACRYDRQAHLERLVLLEDRREHLLVAYRYHPQGQLAAATDPAGHALRYDYKGGVLVTETHKNGLQFHFEWDWYHSEGWCVRTWGDAPQGDAMDLAPGATPPRAIYDRRLSYDKNRRRTAVSDGRGGLSYYQGNDRDLVDQYIDPTGRITKYEWSDDAWKTAEIDGTGARTEWCYDDRGNRIAEIDALEQRSTWRYDHLDRLVEHTDPRGAKVRIDYHTSSEPSAVHLPDGTGYLYTRDPKGRLLHVDDPMGRRTTLEWTDQHDLAAVTDPEKRRTEYRYDLFGRLVYAKDPLGRETKIERDLVGNATYVERADGERLILAYDPEGNLTEQRDSRARVTRMRYAAMGQLVEHIDPLGHKTRLRYDSELDLVAVENPAGDVYTFELDLAGRVTSERTFSGTRRKLAHDKAGRTSRVWTGAHRITDLERDQLGRVVKQVSRGGRLDIPTTPVEETFAYDEAGSLIAARTPSADVVFERDVLGRVTREHEKIAATSLSASVSSRYDAAGLRVERRTSLAHKTDYQYNQAGELTALSAAWDLPGQAALARLGLPQAAMGSFDVRLARDPLGQELARRLPGGVVSLWQRDKYGRPAEQRVLTGASTQSPGRDVLRKGYAWAAPEEIAAISSLDPQTGARTSSQYEYDPRGYLVRQLFSSGEELHRQADPVGNLFRSADQRDRKYGPGGRIEQANGTTYELDADGFLTKKTLSDGATWKYAWDAHGQLIEVARPDGKVVAFTYDAFGRRTTKTYDGRTTEYVWDGDDLVHERVRGEDGEVQSALTTWVFEPGTFTPVAKIEGRKRYGIVTDHLDSPTMLATEAGKIAWKAQLDVYGVPREEPLAGVDAAAESERTTNPWRFPGQYEDQETGLYYNRFRYYDPELGRYLSEDPIGLLGGTALYGYVHDPLGWLDALGLNGVLVIGEGQRAVNQAARELAAAGYPAESMGFPRNQWKGGDPSLESAVDWNRQWIREKVAQGYTVVDIGPDGRVQRSKFYLAELDEVAKTRGKLIKLKKMPSGESVADLRKKIGCAK